MEETCPAKKLVPRKETTEENEENTYIKYAYNVCLPVIVHNKAYYRAQSIDDKNKQRQSSGLRTRIFLTLFSLTNPLSNQSSSCSKHIVYYLSRCKGRKQCSILPITFGQLFLLFKNLFIFNSVLNLVAVIWSCNVHTTTYVSPAFVFLSMTTFHCCMSTLKPP